MMLKWCYILVGLMLCCFVATTNSKSADGHVFTSSFLVKFKRNVDNQQAHEIAERNGFMNLGVLAGSSGREFHFKHTALPHIRTRRSIAHIRVLKKEALVNAAVQQVGFKRVKRGLRTAIPATFIPDKSDPNVGKAPTDPYFPLQWYLRNTGQNGGKPRLDLNVQSAWDQGITGKKCDNGHYG